MTEIMIKGMHCDACIALITMELEENGYEDKVESISLGTNNLGKVVLTTEDIDLISKAKTIINNMENYDVYE